MLPYWKIQTPRSGFAGCCGIASVQIAAMSRIFCKDRVVFDRRRSTFLWGALKSTRAIPVAAGAGAGMLTGSGVAIVASGTDSSGVASGVWSFRFAGWSELEALEALSRFDSCNQAE